MKSVEFRAAGLAAVTKVLTKGKTTNAMLASQLEPRAAFLDFCATGQAVSAHLLARVADRITKYS